MLWLLDPFRLPHEGSVEIRVNRSWSPETVHTAFPATLPQGRQRTYRQEVIRSSERPARQI